MDIRANPASEQTDQIDLFNDTPSAPQQVLRAVAMNLGSFERMRAHEVHMLAARLSRGRPVSR